MSGTVRLGLVGAGRWGRDFIHGGIDGLIVAVPPAAQFPIAEAAIVTAVPVMLKKLLSLDKRRRRR